MTSELVAVSGNTYVSVGGIKAGIPTPPKRPNLTTFNYGTAKPVTVPFPNPMMAQVSFSANSQTPPTPPYPAGSTWGVLTKLRFRDASAMPPWPWTPYSAFKAAQ